ncbi:MAG TPA: helix-hairpin-helix domain-containing protein [Caldimonas sp.]|jgi:competence protein ComEA|nr:helix-hairpin-helix domain-containing protein [Caldimonas sp.]HEX2540585.1 helix-hairpin-helix domain-containing protein [Caldimonas sp.]
MLLRKLIAAGAALLAAGAVAAVEINRASQAELESIKGVGPALSSLIVDERRKGDFAGWDDLRARVKGVGPSTAERLSRAGLTVNGKAYVRN